MRSTGSQYFSSSVCATFQAQSRSQSGGREQEAQLQTHQLPKHIYL